MKKLLAKLFSSHFYKATHYDKMQDALRKEFFIVALSQPREDREEDDPMKHKPSTLAELRTKSFAAGGALVSISPHPVLPHIVFMDFLALVTLLILVCSALLQSCRAAGQALCRCWRPCASTHPLLHHSSWKYSASLSVLTLLILVRIALLELLPPA